MGKNFLKKLTLKKKSWDEEKNIQNYPVGKELNINTQTQYCRTNQKWQWRNILFITVK